MTSEAGAGRVNQRIRTRRAIIEAARELARTKDGGKTWPLFVDDLRELIGDQLKLRQHRVDQRPRARGQLPEHRHALEHLLLGDDARSHRVFLLPEGHCAVAPA